MAILTGRALLAGVIGWPIAHSRSPRLHGFWLDRLGIDGAYLPRISPDGRHLAFRAEEDRCLWLLELPE